MDSDIHKVDVTICGGGPVGLLLAHSLARHGATVYVAEQFDKIRHAMYGRAAMLAPRTLEMLEQLDVEEPLGQTGFVTRGQSSYRGGTKVDSVTYASSNIHDTLINYLLLIRQTYVESAFRDAFQSAGKGSVHYGLKLCTYSIADDSDDYKVRSTLEHTDGSRVQIASKYLIGADGSKSLVREMAGIPFEGSKINRHFIRIDGIVKTNLPNPRQGLVSIDSQSHGSVLYACLDHGRTRIGFKFPEKLYADLGASITKDDVVREAILALKPWDLEFETVDWWTAYSVGQRLAATYRADERVFIAGDAAHTHSSAAAQGLNVGLHDAVNLGWKLAGHIRGDFDECVLDSYTPERRSHAQKVIEADQLLGYLHSGELPPQYRDQPNIDRHKLMEDIYRENQGLNAGIGVAYQPTNATLLPFTGLSVQAGERGPDTLVQRPGIQLPVRLYSLFKNNGKFTTLIFCGEPAHTNDAVKTWRRYLDSEESFLQRNDTIFQFITIIRSENDFSTPEERLGVPPFGRAYYDIDGSAHERYGISSDCGFVVILRSDGTIGTACSLDEGAKASKYFTGFVNAKKAEGSPSGNDELRPSAKALGEVDVQAVGQQGVEKSEIT